jgi:hypothetical protein
MDDFDRLLEFQLHRQLDGVVAAPVPVRRGRAGSGRLISPLAGEVARRAGWGRERREEAPKSIGVSPIELRPDALIFVEHF